MADGVALIARAGPVPDRVEIDVEGPRPARDFAPQPGHEAMRMPLYLR